MIYNEIAKQVEEAEANKQKVAMFHLQVLVHAAELKDTHRNEFCRLIGVAESYAIEFHKMINLAELLEKQGYRIVRKDKAEEE